MNEKITKKPIPPGLQSIFAWCGGSLGLVLRKKFFPSIFGSCGKNVIFGRFLKIHQPKNISIGDRTVISDCSVLDARDFNGEGYGIRLADQVFIGNDTSLVCKGGEIFIDSGANIGSRCRLSSTLGLHIGENTLLAAYCSIGTQTNAESTSMTKANGRSQLDKHTSIGKGCWLGVRVKVLDGALIGNGTIVGAHSLVKESLPNYIIAVGYPATTLRYIR